MRDAAFDKMTQAFSDAMWRAQHWRDEYSGAAYSTRIKAAIGDARAACDEAEKHPEITPQKADK